jgi:hypothetical protein
MSSMRFASRSVLAKNGIKLLEERVVERLQAEISMGPSQIPERLAQQ